ncbi:hypothetical protein AAFF_G00344970 [Aldrovandia affinis]|uniref:Scaffolding anchor of CK1 domain-containing protein n=1 Tax=Aldrovandia affinis TaxID=143900 RepID=A0AAD7R836_9TELE|nr:hypothetical protein AAFF_G00344970 [Aldrovandia affinis]
MIPGATYFLRSGAKITGKVHKHFMLIDGNQVATVPAHQLTGQLCKNPEQRCLGTPAPQTAPTLPWPCVTAFEWEPVFEPASLTSTPSWPQIPISLLPSDETRKPSHKSSHMSGRTGWSRNTCEKCWPTHPQVCPWRGIPVEPPAPAGPGLALCHISTHTCFLTADHNRQTKPVYPPERLLLPVAWGEPQGSAPDSSGSTPDARPHPPLRVEGQAQIWQASDGNLRDCFRKLNKKRQYHYSSICSKLHHMVALLAHRQELVDLTNLALSPQLHRSRRGLPDHSVAMQNTLFAPYSKS